jgi:hypothetical protein
MWRESRGTHEVIGVPIAKQTAKRITLVARHPALGFKQQLAPHEGFETPEAAWRDRLRAASEARARAELDFAKAEDRLRRLKIEGMPAPKLADVS